MKRKDSFVVQGKMFAAWKRGKIKIQHDYNDVIGLVIDKRLMLLTRCLVHRIRHQVHCRSNKQKNKFIKKQA